MNDNPPVFTDVEQPFRIKESAGVGTLVGSVLATDADDPLSENSRVVYRADGGNGSGKLGIRE